MVKLIVLGFAVLLVAVLVFAATKPDTFQVQRTVSIAAPPETIFPLINDFRSWGAWSPYEKKDPAMKRTYSGAERGPGSVYGWEGNGQVGKGRIEIAGSTPPSTVVIKMDMIKPIAAHNVIEFRLQPNGRSTSVTWAMQGRTPYISKLMSVFFDMDRMIGNDFEAGLANLKSVAESRDADARPAAAAAS